jgi:hypothetical protein
VAGVFAAMTRHCRLAAIHLAIVAMLVRALLPAGWMPDLGGSAALVICTADSSAHHVVQQSPGKPVPDDGRHAHEECPFAAAHHVAAPVASARLAAPSLAVRAIDIHDIATAFGPIAGYQPQSPRAPPRFA